MNSRTWFNAFLSTTSQPGAISASTRGVAIEMRFAYSFPFFLTVTVAPLTN